MKKRACITIDEGLHNLVKERNLSLSGILERAVIAELGIENQEKILKEEIKRLKLELEVRQGRLSEILDERHKGSPQILDL